MVKRGAHLILDAVFKDRMEPGGRKGPSSNARQVEAMLEEANKFLYAQDFDNAITKYELILAMDPENTKVMDTYGEVLLEIQQFERAREISLNLSPGDASFSPLFRSFSGRKLTF